MTPADKEGEAVYRRDASWYTCGRGGSASRFHFEGKDCASACGKARMLDLDNPHDARSVEPILRCKARGCREKWPALETSRPPGLALTSG